MHNLLFHAIFFYLQSIKLFRENKSLDEFEWINCRKYSLNSSNDALAGGVEWLFVTLMFEYSKWKYKNDFWFTYTVRILNRLLTRDGLE